MGLNPAYGGAYGATPPVSTSSVFIMFGFALNFNFPFDLSDDTFG